MKRTRMRKYRVIVSADGLPTESYDLFGQAEDDASDEATRRYRDAYGVLLLGGLQLRVVVESIDA
jgi:hypothetical protein